MTEPNEIRLRSYHVSDVYQHVDEIGYPTAAAMVQLGSVVAARYVGSARYIVVEDPVVRVRTPEGGKEPVEMVPRWLIVASFAGPPNDTEQWEQGWLSIVLWQDSPTVDLDAVHGRVVRLWAEHAA